MLSQIPDLKELKSGIITAKQSEKHSKPKLIAKLSQIARLFGCLVYLQLQEENQKAS